MIIGIVVYGCGCCCDGEDDYSYFALGLSAAGVFASREYCTEHYGA